MHTCEYTHIYALKVSKFHLVLYSYISLPCMFESDYVPYAQYCISFEAKHVDNGGKKDSDKLVFTF